MGRTVVRYSEAFKLQVVSELESGKLSSIEEARNRYGITGTLTVKGWLRRFGRSDLMPRVVRVERPDERSELERLRKEVRRLEHALAQTRMKELLNEAYFEIMCEQSGVSDVEAIKKKAQLRLSGEPESAPRRRRR
jgi:transposase